MGRLCHTDAPRTILSVYPDGLSAVDVSIHGRSSDLSGLGDESMEKEPRRSGGLDEADKKVRRPSKGGQGRLRTGGQQSGSLEAEELEKGEEDMVAWNGDVLPHNALQSIRTNDHKQPSPPQCPHI